VRNQKSGEGEGTTSVFILIYFIAETFFLCGRWLAKDEDDGQIVREIAASGQDGVSYTPAITYTIRVFTGNYYGLFYPFSLLKGTRRGSGTDANVKKLI